MEFFPNAEHALIPLFWQHADDHAVLSEEMRRMRSAGIRDCIVEPRFGNIPGYDCVVGSRAMPLPCCAGLLEELDAAPTGKFLPLLPLLWYRDRQGRCADVRYVYMDAVSRRFAENFTGQLGDWCRAHGVRLIGHVVEENGAHARLGYGAGHYFRAMQGLDAAGIDVVNNLLPGHTDGSYATMFNTYDCDFNHWGLAKMASSAAHADPKKQGHALCEAFGAYGWFEGLKLMKWITDHLAVQGVDLLTPHAFSPAPFPDPECPPHFYARGQNPQFRYFPLWATYAKRLSGMLGGAAHVAPVAVVYHAEAEWGGACEPFEKAVKVLSQHQLDCDVVCIDTLLASTVTGGQLAVGGERFRALVVPYAEFLPPTFAKKLAAFAAAGLPVLFTRALPKRCYFGAPVAIPGARRAHRRAGAGAGGVCRYSSCCRLPRPAVCALPPERAGCVSVCQPVDAKGRRHDRHLCRHPPRPAVRRPGRLSLAAPAARRGPPQRSAAAPGRLAKPRRRLWLRDGRPAPAAKAPP